jgi:glycosyltransferase involved in cell wall biosynthesis
VKAQKIHPDSLVLFVDDGSRDQTWTMIEELIRVKPGFAGLKLSRNVGHQRALLAGLLTAPGDMLVSIDADLQDDPEVIEQMVDACLAGADIVYGVRRERGSDTLFKRWSALAFYRMIRSLGAEVLENHADYRLMSRRAIEALREFREVNLFLRGLVPLVGYPSRIVYYSRAERFAGQSKYPLRRMIALALDGVTSLSSLPLRMITLLGLAIFLGTLILSAWTLISVLFTNSTVPGWASTVLPLYFLGGIQILSIGILGEYLGKTYLEAKRRPRFFVERCIGFKPACTGGTDVIPPPH